MPGEDGKRKQWNLANSDLTNSESATIRITDFFVHYDLDVPTAAVGLKRKFKILQTMTSKLTASVV
jgi:hypothetical protein